MKEAVDRFTVDFLEPPKRGAKPVLHRLSPKARQAARRERLKAEGRGFLTAEVSQQILDELTRRSKETKVDKAKIVEDFLNAALFGTLPQEHPAEPPAQGAEAA